MPGKINKCEKGKKEKQTTINLGWLEEKQKKTETTINLWQTTWTRKNNNNITYVEKRKTTTITC